MKITIESTSEVLDIAVPGGGTVPARIWKGFTDGGVPVDCYVTRISPQTHDSAHIAQFESELRSCRTPSRELGAVSFRMIL